MPTSYQKRVIPVKDGSCTEISRILPKASISGLKHCKALYLYSLIGMNGLLSRREFRKRIYALKRGRQKMNTAVLIDLIGR